MDVTIDNYEDHSRYGGRESPATYRFFRICFGFEAYEGACERDLEPGQTLCARCEALAHAYRDQAQDEERQHCPRKAGLFSDEEKEILRENLTPAECFEFDQQCAASEYLDALTTCLRSQSDFALAELRQDPRTPDLAAEVMVWRRDRFQTVKEIIDECQKHDWNRTIYELWVLETARRVRQSIRQLGGIGAIALTEYSRYIDWYDPDPYEGLDADEDLFCQDKE